MHHIIKHQHEYLTDISELKNTTIHTQITEGINTHSLVVVSWMQHTQKINIVKSLLVLNACIKSCFYYNHTLNTTNEINSWKDLKNLFSGYINLYKKPKIVVLENINKLSWIKDFILYVYNEWYKIIIIWNSFQIEWKPEIEILPDIHDTSDIYGSLHHIQDIVDREDRLKILQTTWSDIVLHSIISHFSVKNIEMYLFTLSFISKIYEYVSLREIHKRLSRHIDISLKTLIDYIDFSLQAKIIRKMYKYDIKSEKPITSAIKYYFTDTGIRNVCSQQECEIKILKENNFYLDIIKKWYQVYGGKNGVFEMSFYIPGDTNNSIQNIYIHLSKQSDISEIKKEVRKLQKIDWDGIRYLVVSDTELMKWKKKLYENVEIVWIEECKQKIKTR